MKFVSVVGTRPNFMKLAPLARALAARSAVDHVVVHTGQHYDVAMSESFFSDLALPAPRHLLAVGSSTAPAQTGSILARLEPVLELEHPDCVLVYGDVTSTLAAALAAAQLKFPVAHIEAGLRSRDRSMPEELNRILTDHASDLLFAPSRDAVENLRDEGIRDHRVHFVGNIMIDALVEVLPRARRAALARKIGLQEHEYVLVTLHRPSNVDDPRNLREVFGALDELSRERPVVFPVHPRTRKRMAELGVQPSPDAGVRLVDPLNYSDMLSLLSSARLVVTDSGGLQEETSFLGIPCLTVRPNTERPVTITHGTNRLVRTERRAILDAAHKALGEIWGAAPSLERWDGRTADRIAAILCEGAEEYSDLSIEGHAMAV